MPFETENNNNDSNIVKFEPTSGSSGHIKWIPYTKSFLKELDCAIGPWLFDLYKQYPEIKNGTHYWALSWIPKEMQEKVSTDDLEILSPQKNLVDKLTRVNARQS